MKNDERVIEKDKIFDELEEGIYDTTVTAKVGQSTKGQLLLWIPQKLRRRIGLKAGDIVEFNVRKSFGEDRFDILMRVLKDE